MIVLVAEQELTNIQLKMNNSVFILTATKARAVSKRNDLRHSQLLLCVLVS